MARDRVEIDIVANYIENNVQNNINNTRRAIDHLEQSIERTRNQANRLNHTDASPSVSIRDRATQTLDRLSSGLRTLTRKGWQFSVSILDYATKPLTALKNSLFSIKSLVMAIGAGMATKKFIMEPINLADAYSGAKIGFSTLFGEKKGQQMMDQIDKFAKETPFKTSGVISNVQKMMAYGWDANKIISDMRIIGDAAAATGKGDQGLESIVYALSEIKSKGKLSTQELNQLASAGIKAKAYLAEGLGFGTSDAGMKKLAEALEDGAIGANQAVDLILKGMKEFEGMMDKTANETVGGLKSQIEDVFEINIARKWGQGLQDGAKKGLGSIVKLLDASEKGLKTLGERVYEIGKEISNLAADKLEKVIEKVLEITGSQKFKNASLGGKIKILWDEVIAQPFSTWWDSKGERFISEKMSSLGKGLGTTLSKGLLTILGVKDTGMVDGAASIGSSFAEGFMNGFESKKVGDALADAIVRGFKGLFNGSKLSNILLAGLTLKTLPIVLSGVSSLMKTYASVVGGAEATTALGTVLGNSAAGTGLLGRLGSASAGTGLLGFGANRAIALGAGNLANGASLSAGALSALGLGATAGAVVGAIGVVDGAKDFVKAAQSDYESDKKRNTARGLTKIGAVGAGAVAGAAIGSVIPVVGTGVGALIGAGVGGLTSLLAGNKVADSITNIKKSGEELKNINLDKHFGDITLSTKELQSKITSVIGSKNIKSVEAYTSAVNALNDTALTVATKKNTMDFISFQTANGVLMTESMKSQYLSAAQSIAEDVQNYISKRNYATNSAVSLLFGSDKAGESLKKGFNKQYGKYTEEINGIGQKLNDALAKAISDGTITIDEQKKIDELVAKLTKIQTEVEQKMADKEFEANLAGMKFDYGIGSGDLSAESFTSLNKGLNEGMTTNLDAKKDARNRLLSEVADKYASTAGGIVFGKGKEEYDLVKKQYLESASGIVLKVTDVSLEGLSDAYFTEIRKFEKNLDGSFNFEDSPMNPISSQFETMVNALKRNSTKFISASYGISESSQKAMKEVVSSMTPQKEELESIKKGYESLGLEVPKTIDDALSKINYAEAMSGNVDAMYSVWAKEIANSSQRVEIVEAIESGAADIPKKLKEAILAACKKEKVEPSVDVKVKSNTITEPAVKSTDSVIQNAFSNPFSTTGNVELGLAPTIPFSTLASNFRTNIVESLRNRFTSPISVTQQVNVAVSKTASGSIVEGSTGIPYSDAYLEKNGYTRNKNGQVVKKNANGGFIKDRILSWIGEDGPEVVIPLGSNRRKRGIDLWKKAGQLMGIGNNAEGGAYGNPSSIGRLLDSGSSNSNNTAISSSNSGNSTVNIEVGGITIQLNDNGSGNLAQMIQEQSEAIKDTLCSILADAIDDGFKNVPLATS